MTAHRSDLTRPPNLRSERRTGPVRTQRPIYRDLLPPCNDACPAGENIQGWLDAAQAGRCTDRHLALHQRRPVAQEDLRPRKIRFRPIHGGPLPL